MYLVLVPPLRRISIVFLLRPLVLCRRLLDHPRSTAQACSASIIQFSLLPLRLSFLLAFLHLHSLLSATATTISYRYPSILAAPLFIAMAVTSTPHPFLIAPSNNSQLPHRPSLTAVLRGGRRSAYI